MLIDGAHKSCRINVVPTRYFKENGWHYVGICRACWAMGVGPTSNQRLSWSKEQNDKGVNVICRRRANKIAEKMPALAQQMIVIWAETGFNKIIDVIRKYKIIL